MNQLADSYRPKLGGSSGSRDEELYLLDTWLSVPGRSTTTAIIWDTNRYEKIEEYQVCDDIYSTYDGKNAIIVVLQEKVVRPKEHHLQLIYPFSLPDVALRIFRGIEQGIYAWQGVRRMQGLA